MMLSDMRKRVRVVMFIVAAAFIAGFLMSEIWRMLATRGSRGRTQDTHGYVGQVGKHNITPEEYQAARSYTTDKYKSDNRLRDLSSEDYQAVEQQAWQFLLSEITWAKVLKAENIRVTQDEVMEIIKSNPPEDIRNKPELMTDGKFDEQKYLKIINAPENRAYFSKYYRDLLDMLPKEKFRMDVLNTYRVTNRETEDALAAANTKWKVTALFFGPRPGKGKPPAEPSDSEVRAWYDAHKENFRAKETRQVRYVFFPLGVTSDDSAAAKQTIDRAYDQLLKGETFNLTMLDYSDLEGETLSIMIPRSQLDKPTDSVVGRLKPGTFSPPFLAAYGWQIALLDSANKDSVAFRRILVRVTMGTEAVATARDSVRSFLDKAAAMTFDSAAARFSLPVTLARPMATNVDDYYNYLNIESPSQLVEWAKKAKVGQVLDKPQLGAKGYYVFALVEAKPAGIQEFDKAKTPAIWQLQQDKQKRIWLAKAEEALAAVKAGKSLEQYAEGDSDAELQSEEFDGLLDCRRKKGPEFAGTVAVLNPGEEYGVVEANWGAFIVRCDERTTTSTLDPAAYAQQRRQQIAQDLMQEMLKQPEIKDYRDALAY
ncbi:MAG: peptidylprolyl isomerase [candidate division WOR-3 bacterium]|nr:peptidylprolyl isomerase [candidate division WOR-3 bacterium]